MADTAEKTLEELFEGLVRRRYMAWALRATEQDSDDLPYSPDAMREVHTFPFEIRDQGKPEMRVACTDTDVGAGVFEGWIPSASTVVSVYRDADGIRHYTAYFSMPGDLSMPPTHYFQIAWQETAPVPRLIRGNAMDSSPWA